MWKIPFVFSIIVKNAEKFKQISLFLKNTYDFDWGKICGKNVRNLWKKKGCPRRKNRITFFYFGVRKKKQKSKKVVHNFIGNVEKKKTFSQNG